VNVYASSALKSPSLENVKNSITVRRLIAWTWLAALLLTGSASAAYVCPTDMAGVNVVSLRQVGCADDDQPALCATYLRGAPASATQPHPPAGGDAPPRIYVQFWRLASPTAQEVLPAVRNAPSPSPVPIYLATARLRP
jgi:hypothetical protein